ncbi:MAG: fluoride efflux transporter CrcB [Pikeienuella sp.]
MNLIIVGMGGALGAMLRHLSGVAALRIMGAGFPWGTLFVNVVGSFLMGLAAVLILGRFGHSPHAAGLVMTGFLGGFTTFSAFSLDVFRLLETGRAGAAALYVGGSVALSIGALFIGFMIARGLE